MTNDKWHLELHNLLQDFADKHKLRTTQMLSVLTLTLVGTMAMQGYSDELAKKTFDRMFSLYQKKRKEFEEDERKYIFSSELRKRMSKFGDKPIDECLKSKDFWTELALHGGITKEKLQEIMDRKPSAEEQEKFDNMTQEQFHDYLNSMIEEAMPDILKSMENKKS